MVLLSRTCIRPSPLLLIIELGLVEINAPFTLGKFPAANLAYAGTADDVGSPIPGRPTDEFNRRQNDPNRGGRALVQRVDALEAYASRWHAKLMWLWRYVHTVY